MCGRIYVCFNSHVTFFPLIQGGQPVTEEIQPMEVTVTASMPKATPPKVIRPLQDAEVMEGEKSVQFYKKSSASSYWLELMII